MRRTTRFFFAAAAALTVSATGCELLSTLDRTQIPDERTPDGGIGGMETSSSSSSSSGTAGSGGTGGMAGAGGTAGMGGTAGAGGVAGMGGTGGTAGMGGTGGTGGGGITCNSPSECPATGNECIAATCNGNVCGTTFVSAGTPVSSQTDKDCKINQCDGAGNVTTVNDDNDVPDDQNDCTMDVC